MAFVLKNDFNFQNREMTDETKLFADKIYDGKKRGIFSRLIDLKSSLFSFSRSSKFYINADSDCEAMVKTIEKTTPSDEPLSEGPRTFLPFRRKRTYEVYKKEALGRSEEMAYYVIVIIAVEYLHFSGKFILIFLFFSAQKVQKHFETSTNNQTRWSFVCNAARG